MSNYNDIKKYGFNDASYSYKESTHPEKKPPVEYDENKCFGTRPGISMNFSPVYRQI